MYVFYECMIPYICFIHVSCFTEDHMLDNVTSTPGHVLTTSLLRPKKIKDVVRTWYGLVGRGRNVVRT